MYNNNGKVKDVKKIVIIKAGRKLPGLSAIAGDFEDWIMDSMDCEQSAFMTVSVVEGEMLPAPENVKAILITGSAAMVTDRCEWMLKTAAWLRESAAEAIPMLGICFGHQLLAYALGGKVSDNPQGVEVGTVRLNALAAAEQDDLFAGINVINVQASHRQVVTGLPAGAVNLASTAMDPFHVFRYGENIWGVQFHPEFNATITGEYIRLYKADLQAAGVDLEQKLGGCRETPEANSLLKKFCQIAGVE